MVASVVGSALDSPQARSESSLINVRSDAFLQRARCKINLANQTGAVLMINQRRAGAFRKSDLRVGNPFFHNRRELRGRDAVTAIIVDEVGELGLQGEPHELLRAIVFMDPGVTRLRPKRQRDGFAEGGLGSEMLGPHDGAALAAVTEKYRRR